MRVVLYDDETGEAITVLDMLDWHQLRIPVGQPIKVPVFRPVSFRPTDELVAAESTSVDTVTVRFERLNRPGRASMWVAFTGDTESALVLRSTFLPGQRSKVSEIKQREFASGFLSGRYAAIDRNG